MYADSLGNKGLASTKRLAAINAQSYKGQPYSLIKQDASAESVGGFLHRYHEDGRHQHTSMV